MPIGMTSKSICTITREGRLPVKRGPRRSKRVVYKHHTGDHMHLGCIACLRGKLRGSWKAGEGGGIKGAVDFI